MALKYHPDKGGDEDVFKKIGECYNGGECVIGIFNKVINLNKGLNKVIHLNKQFGFFFYHIILINEHIFVFGFG